MRYPILVVLGQSFTGKTEWAKSLFKNPLVLLVGTLEHFPARMETFNRKVHDGVILDDIRDFKFVTNHQEKMQGKYDALVEFCAAGGQICVYRGGPDHVQHSTFRLTFNTQRPVWRYTPKPTPDVQRSGRRCTAKLFCVLQTFHAWRDLRLQQGLVCSADCGGGEHVHSKWGVLAHARLAQ